MRWKVLVAMLAVTLAACQDMTRPQLDSEVGERQFQAAVSTPDSAEAVRRAEDREIFAAARDALPIDGRHRSTIGILDAGRSDQAVTVVYLNGTDQEAYRFHKRVHGWTMGGRVDDVAPRSMPAVDVSSGAAISTASEDPLAEARDKVGNLLYSYPFPSTLQEGAWSPSNPTGFCPGSCFQNGGNSASWNGVGSRVVPASGGSWHLSFVRWDWASTILNQPFTGFSSSPSTGTTFLDGGNVYYANIVTLSYRVDFHSNVTSSVELSSTNFGMAVGGNWNLTATARNNKGTILTGKTATWASSNPAVATVTSTGPMTASVTGIGVGTATITATIEGVTKSANVNVFLPPLKVNIAGPWTPPLNSVCTWEAVVTDGTPPYSYKWFVDGNFVSPVSSYSGMTGTTDFLLRLEVTDAAMSTVHKELLVDVQSMGTC